MNNLFSRAYMVNYIISCNDGDTFEPGSMVIYTSSVHNAHIKAEKILWEEGFIPEILSVHPLDTFAGRIK